MLVSLVQRILHRAKHKRKREAKEKGTSVVQEKAESADKSQSAEAREQKAKTESVLENDKEKGTGGPEKIISENQKVKNEEKVDFKEKNRQKEQLYYYI